MSGFGKSKQTGFTIVELLIVIVVIGILAAIVIVAYNGVQRSAKNTAIAAAVSTFAKQIQMYKTENSAYPIETNGSFCASIDNKCTLYSGSVNPNNNATLMSAIKTVSNPLDTWPGGSTSFYGAYYGYNTSWTYKGTPNPVMIVFWLEGTNQDCNVVGSLTSVVGSGTDYTPAKNNKADTGSGQTRCYEMFAN